MSSQRSPYQTGSGIGLQSLLAYINANPNSIKAAIETITTQQTYPKTATVLYGAVPNALFSEATQTTIFSDVSSLFSTTQKKFIIPISGTYQINIQCVDHNIQNATIWPRKNGSRITYISNPSFYIMPSVKYDNETSTIVIEFSKGDTLDFDTNEILDYAQVALIFIHT